MAICQKFKLNEQIWIFKFAQVLLLKFAHNGPLTNSTLIDLATECDRGLLSKLLNAEESTECERQIASGEVDDAYTSTEQQNSPWLDRPG